MLKFRFMVPALAALLIGATAPAQTTAQQPADAAAAQRIRGHVEFLASDLLEGREPGTRGHEIAASYVASEFRKLGLQPGGRGGSWYQQVPFRRASHVGIPTVALVRNGHRTEWASGKDFGLRPSLTAKARSIDAELVFVGHGVSEPRFRIDDYAGVDVRGKIVVTIEGAPQGLPSDVSAHAESTKDELAASKGAVGFIELSRNGDLPGRMSPLERKLRPLLGWVDSAGRAGGPGGALAVDLALSGERAEQLFAGAPKSLAAVRAEAGRGRVRGFPLRGRLQIRAQSEWQDFTSPNVVAVLPGRDQALAQEFIVLMGHLDHLGTNPAAQPGEDAIYNGAIDNAGGIATMIEAARSFASAGAAKRSILFIATTAEERGLLGADYFAIHPTVPVDRIAGLVNLDMPLLLYDFTDVIPFGAEHSTIGASVAAVAKSSGVRVSPDPMPEQALFTRSDHYPFVRQGVPSVFLMTGHGNGGKKAWDDFLAGAYHQVNDDLSQPIHWRAGARFAELNYRIARALADAPERPLWYQGSYFGDAFAAGRPKAKR